MLEKEAFAHMFAAQFDADRYALMQKYFPTALVEFEKLLKKTMEELFDREQPFTQTEEEHTCSFCDFRNICGK